MTQVAISEDPVRVEAPGGVLEVGGSGAAIWHVGGPAPVPVAAWTGATGPDDLRRLAAVASLNGPGILLTTPGQIDPDGRVSASNLGWDSLDLAGAIQLEGRDVRWVNDAAAVAAGERILHELEGRVLVLGFGTGLSVGVADDDGARTLMLSPTLEASHMPLDSTEPCACGRVGCMEAVARAWLRDGRHGELFRDGVASLVEGSDIDYIVLCGGALRADGVERRVRDLLDHRTGVSVLASAVHPGEKSAAPHAAAALWAVATCL